jgi:hypothetical protein
MMPPCGEPTASASAGEVAETYVELMTISPQDEQQLREVRHE